MRGITGRSAVCVLAACAVGAVHAADTDAGFVDTPVAGSVRVLQGLDCNVVVSVGDDGMVVVDTGAAETGAKLLASLQKLSAKPLRFVFDTHAHGDHAGGNAALQPHAPIIAHRATRDWLATGNAVTGDKPAAPEALPVITFDGELVLHLNGEEIRARTLSPAHTNGDVVVFFEKANVVAIGDVFMPPGMSFGDRHYGSGMPQLIDALETLLPQIPADAKVIPGHGAVSTRADVAHGLDVMKKMKALVEAAIRAGKTEQQLIAERPFDQWRNEVPEWASSDRSLDGFVRDFYRPLSKR